MINEVVSGNFDMYICPVAPIYTTRFDAPTLHVDI